MAHYTQMNLQQIGRVGLFLAGSVVGGLALAFVLVLARPQLLLQRAASGAATPAGALAAPAATSGPATGTAAEPAAAPLAPA